MEITLEMVDEVIERTGASYKQAKGALNETGGDILDAIVLIEDGKYNKETKAHKTQMIDKLKELVDKGMVNKILVKKDGNVIIQIPVAAGAVSAMIFAGPTIIALGTAIATGCDVFIVKDDGEKINVKEYTSDKYHDVKEKFQEKKED